MKLAKPGLILAVVLVLQVLDAGTTVYGVTQAHRHEANGIMRLAMEMGIGLFLALKLALAAILVGLLALHFKINHRHAVANGTIQLAFGYVVVFSNVLVILG